MTGAASADGAIGADRAGVSADASAGAGAATGLPGLDGAGAVNLLLFLLLLLLLLMMLLLLMLELMLQLLMLILMLLMMVLRRPAHHGQHLQLMVKLRRRKCTVSLVYFGRQ